MSKCRRIGGCLKITCGPETPCLCDEQSSYIAKDIEDIDDLKEAIEFYDKVMNSSNDDRIAVGTDHLDWLISASRKVIAHYH